MSVGKGLFVTTSERVPAWDPEPDLAWLVALARRLARPGDDADDLAQETLLVAMQQPQRASRSWLAGVARNLGRMRARTDGRRRAREGEVVGDDADTPEDVLGRIETLDALRDALGGLDEIDRKLVLGRYAAGQTAVALGQQLDLPASTVRTRLQRAKEKLRRDVEKMRGVGCFAPFALLDRSAAGSGAVVGGVAMSTATKVGIGAGAIVLLAIGAQQLVASPPREEVVTVARPAPEPATTVSKRSTTTKPATISAAEMRAKRERIREAREERLAALASARGSAADEGDEAVGDRCDDGCIGTLTLQVLLADVMAACRDDLPAGAQGTTKFRAHVLAEPEVGAVVDAVEVLEDTVRDAAFTECIVESAPLVRLVDPDNPVSDSFVFRYTVGDPPQATAEFLAARPDLLAQHPEFAALAKLQPGQAPAPEDASAFARWLEEDLDAQAAFAKWVTEQGFDLANVKVEGDPPPAR